MLVVCCYDISTGVYYWTWIRFVSHFWLVQCI